MPVDIDIIAAAYRSNALRRQTNLPYTTMPSTSQQQAADLIWQHWQQRTHLAALPSGLKPATRAEGYAIQACFEARSAKPLYGWKIAATSIAGQQHIQVDQPLAGRILAERVYESGAELPLAGNQMRVAEGEFAFRMARDLPPRVARYTTDEVLAAVATLHPAIEVPDSRFAPFEAAGGPQLIADNACTDFLVVGAPAAELWRSLDLTQHAVSAHHAAAHDGSVTAIQGVGSNVLGNPLVALTWIANELSGIKVTLRAGELVTTGTCFKPFAIAPGDAVEINYGVLGSVAVRFALG